MVDWMTKGQRSRTMSAIRSRDTKPEITVRKLVFSLGYRYRLHVGSLPGKPDLAFPKMRKVIEVRGCFWHRHTCRDGRRIPEANREYWSAKIGRNIQRDFENELRLARLGWKTLVIWECQTRDAVALREIVICFLNAPPVAHRKPAISIAGIGAGRRSSADIDRLILQDPNTGGQIVEE